MAMSSPTVPTIETTGDVVRVVQLTDTHLCESRGGTLLGMDTDHSLQAIIDLVRRERPDVDLLLGTGDLADGGAQSAYDRLQAYLDQLTPNNYWLPGNHDSRPRMETAASDPARLSGELRSGQWQILMLDSQIPGKVEGLLGEDELARLDQRLQAASTEGLYTLVCLHHQPVKVGSRWIDEQMISDADAFFDVLDNYPGARAVLWGHVHQEIDRERNGVRLLASPSTCVQFAPDSEGFKADDQPPGYRWLDLYSDGRIETGVSRDCDTSFQIDLDSGGYL